MNLLSLSGIDKLSGLYLPFRKNKVVELVMTTTTGKLLSFGNLLRILPSTISEETY